MLLLIVHNNPKGHTNLFPSDELSVISLKIRMWEALNQSCADNQNSVDLQQTDDDYYLILFLGKSHVSFRLIEGECKLQYAILLKVIQMIIDPPIKTNNPNIPVASVTIEGVIKNLKNH